MKQLIFSLFLLLPLIVFGQQKQGRLSDLLELSRAEAYLQAKKDFWDANVYFDDDGDIVIKEGNITNFVIYEGLYGRADRIVSAFPDAPFPMVLNNFMNDDRFIYLGHRDGIYVFQSPGRFYNYQLGEYDEFMGGSYVIIRLYSQ